MYGTLKRGHGNHQLINSEGGHRNQLQSDYLGCGLTKDKLRMTIKGVPFIHAGNDPVDGARLSLELYEVHSPKARLALDQLEGHPHHYRRRLTQVELSDGTFISIWVYMVDKAPYAGDEIYYYYPSLDEGQRAEYLYAYAGCGRFEKESKITTSPTHAELAYTFKWSDEPSDEELSAEEDAAIEEEVTLTLYEEAQALEEELEAYDVLECDHDFQQDAIDIEVEEAEEVDDSEEGLPPLSTRLKLRFLRN